MPYIKITLNEQVLKSVISLKNVRKANENERKSNLLATKLMKETHNFTYNEFNELNTVNEIANKIKEIYQQDLVVGYFDTIAFDPDNDKILPSTKLQWGENIIPLVIQYNGKSTKIDLKINLMNQEQFSEYEVNRVVDKILLNVETTNSIFGVTANIEQPADKVLLWYFN